MDLRVCEYTLVIITVILTLVGFNWIRAEAFVFSHIGDEGPIHSCAAELLRYRNAIEAQDVMVFTDIKKKHR